MVKSAIKRIIGRALARNGYALTPLGSPYLDSDETIRAAKNAGLSLHQYIYRNDAYKAGRTDRIINKIAALFAADESISVVEIGTGTGMYLERVLSKLSCKAYHVFETHIGWKNYLRDTFSPQRIVHVYDCDGSTLNELESGTIDLVHAHAVFVYTPTLTTISYLREASRVLKPCGFFVFDCFLDSEFDANAIAAWEASEHRFPILTSTKLLSWQMPKIDFVEVGRFDEVYGPHFANYLIYKKVPQ